METTKLEFKGTKGNWETNLKRYEFSKGYNAIEIQVKTNEKHFLGKWVAQVNSVIKEDFEEDKANAKLISAAPDLLEAIQYWLSLEKDYENIPDEARKKLLPEIKQRFEKAVEKALK